MGSRESSFHIEGLVYQRSVRSDGMFKEQQEGQYYGQRREREDGGQGSQGGSEHHTYPASFQVGRAITSFQEKGLMCSVCFERDQVGIHFNIYPESPCCIHLKFLVIGTFHLSINSLYLLSFSRNSNWMD